MGVSEISRKKGKKMVEIKSLKTSSFASWNALLCSIKIVLAISSTIVFTYACAIQNIDEEFFNGTDFCQSHLICQFETLIQVTKYVLYSYAILCGIMSVLWLIRNCLMKDKYFPNFDGYNNNVRQNNLNLHLIFHFLGFCHSVTSIIVNIIYLMEKSDVLAILENTNAIDKDNHVDLYSTSSLNSFAMLAIFVNLMLHAYVVVYIFLNRHAEKFNFRKIEEAEKAREEIKERKQSRLRLPSTRNFPSSPINMNRLAISPSLQRKVPNSPRLLSVKNKENELKIDVMALETEAAVEVKESDDKVLEFEPRKSLFSDDEDIMMN